MKKHIVVGGGIAGIVTAYHLMQRGCSVILLETAATIGGLLASKEINGRYYDHGTHILAETGIKELDTFLFDGLECEYFQYAKVGSYIGALYAGNGFINDFSFPSSLRQEMLDAFTLHPRTGEGSHQNLKAQLIGDYGVLIYEKLLEPTLRKFFHSDPQDLVPDSQGLFGLSRIMLGDAENSRALKADPTYDRLLGYHSYTEGASMHRSLYPKRGGVGAWIDLLQAKLLQGGVEIITNTELRLQSENNQIRQAVINGATYEVSQLYWTVPAVFIYEKLNLKKLPGSPPKRLTSVVVDVEIDGNYATDVFYVQNYDPSMRSFRVTLYDNYNEQVDDSTKRITVEFLAEGGELDESFYGSQAVLELKQMGLVESGAVMRVVGCEFVKGGFPVPTPAFAAAVRNYAEGLADISNLFLFGKATGRTWFMADVIREIHQYFANENNNQG